MLKTSYLAIILSSALLGACGTIPTNDFPNRLIGADGQEFFLEDLEDIANNSSMTEAQRRDAFRDLGIEDEELIDALLNL